jgi:hypothetical protein
MLTTHITNKKWKKNIYKPINQNKYKGSQYPVARSGWEYKMCRFLDLNENVIEWISEQPLIPYLNPNTGTTWNYYPDFLIKVKTSTGIKIQLIEIKPKKQTVPPIVTAKKKKKTILTEAATWSVNKAKWAAAKIYCSQRGWDFKILTEDDIFV